MQFNWKLIQSKRKSNRHFEMKIEKKQNYEKRRAGNGGLKGPTMQAEEEKKSRN